MTHICLKSQTVPDLSAPHSWLHSLCWSSRAISKHRVMACFYCVIPDRLVAPPSTRPLNMWKRQSCVKLLEEIVRLLLVSSSQGTGHNSLHVSYIQFYHLINISYNCSYYLWKRVQYDFIHRNIFWSFLKKIFVETTLKF